MMGDGRIPVAQVADMIGLTVRAVQQMAARGDIPSAAKFGRRYTFDALTIRRWIKQREAELCPTKTYSAEAPSGGAGFRLPDATSNEAYERLIGLRPGGGSRNGLRT